MISTVFHAMSMPLVSVSRVEIRGFGSFTVRDCGGHTGRNPSTDEENIEEPRKPPFFKTSEDFREGVGEMNRKDCENRQSQ